LGCYENAQNAIAYNAVAKNLDLSIHVYPNPSNGKFKVSVAEEFVGGTIKLSDANGKTYFNGKITSNESSYDFSNKPNGVYYLILKNTTLQQKTLKLEITK